MPKQEKSFPLSTVGGRIQERRHALRISRSELYDKVYQSGKSCAGSDSSKEKTVYNWESEKTQLDYETIRKMCEVLDCSSDYLLGLDECKSKNNQFIHDKTGLSEEAINRIVTPRGNLFLDTLITSEEFYKIDMLFDAIHRDYHLAESCAKEMRKLELEYATYQDNSIEKQEINIMYDKYQDNVNRAEERIASGMYRISLFWGNALESYRNKRNKIIQSILQLTDNS